MQPIDYMQGYKSALDSILNQARSFQDLSQNANILQSQREQNRITTAHNDRRIQAMNELQGVDFNDENKLREWAGRYGDLEYGKGLNEYLGRLDEQAKKAEIGRVSQVYSLLRNGKDDVAIADLEQQALAYENAGDKANANGARQMAQLIRADRNSALMNVGMAYAHLVPKDTMDNLKDLNSAYAPNVHYQDMGGSMQAVIVDPVTGEIKTQHLGDKTQSPDSIANNELERWKTQGGWDNAITVEGMRQDGAMARTQYTTQADLAKAQAQIDADIQKQQNQLAYNAQQERLKSGQIMTATDGYQMIYYPNETDPNKKAEYLLDPNGNRIKGQVGVGKISDSDKKAVREAEEQIMSSQNTVNQLGRVISNLEDGTLNLGLLSNAWNMTRNGLLGSTKESLAYEEMNRTINSAVNQVLMLAKGTQTEGDAQRAANTILSAPRWDNKVVMEALRELQDVARRTIALKQRQINDILGVAGGSQAQSPRDIASRHVSDM